MDRFEHIANRVAAHVYSNMGIPTDVQHAVDEAVKQTPDREKQEFIRGYLRLQPSSMSVEDFQTYVGTYEDPLEDAATQELLDES